MGLKTHPLRTEVVAGDEYNRTFLVGGKVT